MITTEEKPRKSLVSVKNSESKAKLGDRGVIGIYLGASYNRTGKGKRRKKTKINDDSDKRVRIVDKGVFRNRTAKERKSLRKYPRMAAFSRNGVSMGKLNKLTDGKMSRDVAEGSKRKRQHMSKLRMSSLGSETDEMR